MKFIQNSLASEAELPIGERKRGLVHSGIVLNLLMKKKRRIISDVKRIFEVCFAKLPDSLLSEVILRIRFVPRVADSKKRATKKFNQ